MLKNTGDDSSIKSCSTKRTLYILTLLFLVFTWGTGSANGQSKARTIYVPPQQKVLVFIGQDNASVGGNNRFHDGYIDNVDLPAGITHYIGLGTTDSSGNIGGLNSESDWKAGPMCLKYYMESQVLKDCIIHLSIDMVNLEADVVAGKLDTLIFEIADFLNTYKDRPFLVRIGYEFDGAWNHYDTTAFVGAFRRIVDTFREKKVGNLATVFAASSPVVPYSVWEKYYPGDNYVDWTGYSYWGGSFPQSDAITFARNHNKPVFIAEITPRGHFFDKEDGRQIWDEWFTTFFKHIEQYGDDIKAISYINCNWDAQDMWTDWGNTRFEENPFLKSKWREKMQDPLFIRGNTNVFKLIKFKNQHPE